MGALEGEGRPAGGRAVKHIPLAEQIAEVKRELAQRQRVYRRLLDNGSLTNEMVERRMLRMHAVLTTLEHLSAQGQRHDRAR